MINFPRYHNNGLLVIDHAHSLLCTKECQNPAIHDYIYDWVCSRKWDNEPVEGMMGGGKNPKKL